MESDSESDDEPIMAEHKKRDGRGPKVVRFNSAMYHYDVDGGRKLYEMPRSPSSASESSSGFACDVNSRSSSSSSVDDEAKVDRDRIDKDALIKYHLEELRRLQEGEPSLCPPDSFTPAPVPRAHRRAQIPAKYSVAFVNPLKNFTRNYSAGDAEKNRGSQMPSDENVHATTPPISVPRRIETLQPSDRFSVPEQFIRESTAALRSVNSPLNVGPPQQMANNIEPLEDIYNNRANNEEKPNSNVPSAKMLPELPDDQPSVSSVEGLSTLPVEVLPPLPVCDLGLLTASGKVKIEKRQPEEDEASVYSEFTPVGTPLGPSETVHVDMEEVNERLAAIQCTYDDELEPNNLEAIAQHSSDAAAVVEGVPVEDSQAAVSAVAQPMFDQRINLDAFSTRPEYSGKRYLAAIPLTADEQKLQMGNPRASLLLSRPLGVTYDEDIGQWIVVDDNKVVFFPSGKTLESVLLTKPSAVVSYKMGESIAILSSTSIIIAKFTDLDFALAIVTDQLNGKVRGLGVTPNKNLVTIVCDQSLWTVVVYNAQGMNEKLHSLPFAKSSQGGPCPCFLDVFKTSLLVTDLGQNALILFRFDENTDEVSHMATSVQKWDRSSSEPNGYFAFVSGIFYDSTGLALIADADGRSLQLFDHNGAFIQRVSFPATMPYTSGFYVNRDGVLALCQRSSYKAPLAFYKLTMVAEQMKHTCPPPRRT